MNARFVKPLDEELIIELANDADKIVTVEEGVIDGGFGSAVPELLIDKGIYKPVRGSAFLQSSSSTGKEAEILDVIRAYGRKNSFRFLNI